MEFLDLLIKLKPFLTEKDYHAYHRLYLASEGKPLLKRSVERKLYDMAIKHLGQDFFEEDSGIFLEPPPPQTAYGEDVFGKVYYGPFKTKSVFGLRPDEWIRHMTVMGKSGSGKTTVTFVALRNLLKRNIPFLIFDWKRNYRDIIPHFPDKRILVFTVGRDVSPFRWNPLIPPPGVPAKIWMGKLLDQVSYGLYLGHGVNNILRKAIVTLYSKYNVFAGKASEWPTWVEILEWLTQYKRSIGGRRAEWFDSTERAVEHFVHGPASGVYNVHKPIPIEKLLGEFVILELEALNIVDKKLIIGGLVEWIRQYKLYNVGKREQHNLQLIIEEAHNVLIRGQRMSDSEETIMDTVIREVRELGIGVTIIDQHPHFISLPALGNAHCKIAMQLETEQDVHAMATSMLLQGKEKWNLGRLDTGWGIVKISREGWKKRAFLVKFPMVYIKKGSVTDDDVKQAMQERMRTLVDEVNGFPKGKRDAASLLRYLLVKGREVVNEANRLLRNEIGKEEPPQPVSGLQKPSENESREAGEVGEAPPWDKEIVKPGERKPSRQEIAFLLDVLFEKDSAVIPRYVRLKMNTYQGWKVQKSLVEKGWIHRESRTGKEGTTVKLSLLEEGARRLQECFAIDATSKRHGSFEHEAGKEIVSVALKKEGYQVRKELALGGGGAVDVAGLKKGKKEVACEVETMKRGKQVVQAMENVRKGLAGGFERVWIIVLREKDVGRIEEGLKSAGLEGKANVSVRRVAEFYPALMDNGE